MAAGALEDGIIGRVGVARGADPVRVAMVHREERVIAGRQGCGHPRGGGVAGGAGGGPARCRVIGIRGPGEVRLVAGVAIGRRSREDVIDVAKIAGHRGVRAGQRERRVVVIEGCARPVRGGVAGVAGGGEARRRVIGIGGAVPIRLVASVAGVGSVV